MATPPADVTQLLLDYSGGNRDILNELFELVYEELRRIAQRQMRGERGDHTLSTTALVHEAYLKLVDQTRARWQNRAHFYAVASQAMRRILVSYARKKNALKRGGDAAVVTLHEGFMRPKMEMKELIDLDDALERLAKLSERQCRVVECRFFGGLSVEETAEALEVSPATVKRDWRLARAWLFRELHPDGPDASTDNA